MTLHLIPHGQGRQALPPVITVVPAIPVIVVAMLALLAPATSRAADGQWQFGSAPSFSSGKYGTDTSTQVLYTPITARRLFDAGDVSFVFPFTCIWGNEGVTIVNGTPVRQQRIAANSTSANRGGRTAASSGAARSCGLGDIVVRGRYYLLDERGWAPTIAVRAHVKMPTASAEHGLGTGRPDEGVGIEVSRTFPGGVLAMVDGGYTIIGKPANVELKNSWWYDLGVGRDLVNGVVNLSVLFEEYRAIVPGLANARDVLTAVSLPGVGSWRVQVSGQFGLSDGAPAHGVTIGASRRF